MAGVNLKTMPVGKLYEYADGQYVWKVLRAGGTRGGNYLTDMDDPSEYTEVFSKNKNGELVCDWSGDLITNPSVSNEKGLDSQGCFSIFSYDQDARASFKQEKELSVAPIELQKKALNDEKNVMKFIAQKLEEEKKRKF